MNIFRKYRAGNALWVLLVIVLAASGCGSGEGDTAATTVDTTSGPPTVTVEGVGEVEIADQAKVKAELQWPATIEDSAGALVKMPIPEEIPLPEPFKIDIRYFSPDEPGVSVFIDMTPAQGRSFFEQALAAAGWQVTDVEGGSELAFTGHGWEGTVSVVEPSQNALEARGEGFQSWVSYGFRQPGS